MSFFWRKQEQRDGDKGNYGAIELERDDEAHHHQTTTTSSTSASVNNNNKKDDSSSPPPSMESSAGSGSTVPEQAWITRSGPLERLISEVRSEDDSEKLAETNESAIYRDSSALERALPERLFALTITMLLEIPVLLMVSGGSDALCELIGRRRYQLLVGFLPLTSAISGNVGLQASTLTTRAISHSHVTIQDYGVWLWSEIKAAFYLGVGMGCLLGGVAFIAAQDWAFGVTIFMAQVLSILTAGLTGTMAPLIFSFLFHRDSGKWGGPLETAVQDIVGSFAMVVVSYHLLKFLGPGPIDPFDVCGPGSISSSDD